MTFSIFFQAELLNVGMDNNPDLKDKVCRFKREFQEPRDKLIAKRERRDKATTACFGPSPLSCLCPSRALNIPDKAVHTRPEWGQIKGSTLPGTREPIRQILI